jgi:hypothetical protein
MVRGPVAQLSVYEMYVKLQLDKLLAEIEKASLCFSINYSKMSSMEI